MVGPSTSLLVQNDESKHHCYRLIYLRPTHGLQIQWLRPPPT
jgi:hypothetical protein